MRLSILLLFTALSLDAQTIRGRVVDADAKPVAGAQVQLALGDRTMLDYAATPSVLTAEDGRYEMPAPPLDFERIAVLVTLPNHAPIRSERFDVALPRFERVTVRVNDADEKPLKDARVVFASSDETSGFRSLTYMLMDQYEKRFARTGDDGIATVYVPQGTWDFAMKADGHQAAVIAEQQIKRATSLEVSLERAFAIRGRVHRKDVPVAEAQIFVLNGNVERRAISTDVDGKFEIPDLAPGKYTLRFRKMSELLEHTVDAKAPSTIDVALPPAGTLRARIVDAETREPVPQFLFSIGDEQRGERTENGIVTLNVPAGVYRISAAAIGYTPAEPMDVGVKENETSEITIALDRGISISGRVTDENGDPVDDAMLFFERTERRSANRIGPNNTTTAADGSFTVTGLRPGTVTATVRKEGFVPFVKAIDVDAVNTLDVQLTRGLSLEGIVRLRGKPVANAQIDASTQALGGAHQTVNSDANGRFVLTGLVAARYTVSAFLEDLNTEQRDVDPTKTRELVLSLDAKPTGVLYGVVSGIPAGSNIGGAKITRRAVFIEGRDRGVEAMIGDDGSYRFDAAPLGKAYVTAQLETTTGGRSSARKQVEIIAGQPLRLDLELGGSVLVRGRVTLDGKPLAGVRVVFAGLSGIAASATTRTDGAYELALAETGRYQVFAHAESLARGTVQLVREVRGGGDTIDVEMREQAIEGIVTDAATQAPIAGVFVTLMPEQTMPDYYSGEALTDGNGRFHLLSAASGSYRVVAWARGYAQRALPLQLGRGAMPPIAMELEKIGDLRVRVVDAASGTPLGAHIAIEGVPVRLDRDADGVTLAGSLAPGRYRMKIVVPGYEDRVIEVTAPGSVEVRME